MTQEEKQLLLKDLCARLPYDVLYAEIVWEDGVAHKVSFINTGIISDLICDEIKSIKPYLRPMSSMTEEERRDMSAAIQKDKIEPWCEIKNSGEDNLLLCTCRQSSNMQDWLNANQFDYRGLIPMGLALEAPKGMYKTE